MWLHPIRLLPTIVLGIALGGAALADVSDRPRPRPSAAVAADDPLGDEILSTMAPMRRPDLTEVGLAAAMAALRTGDWPRATDLAEDAGPLASDIVAWHRLRAGRGDFDEVRAFLSRNGDWPGLPYLRRQTEAQVPQHARPREVIAHFTEAAPQTGAGQIRLAAAHATLGHRETADALLVRAWTSSSLSAGDEADLLDDHGALLRPHHAARLDHLLWEGSGVAARRMFPRVSPDWRALAEARLALRNGTPGVDALVDAVPSSLADDPGLAYERFAWRAAKGRNDSAIELALAVPDLGRPEAWANWRRVLARWAMRDGAGKTAYRLAATHALTEGADFADLEWLAGYLALRYLDDPETALGHFRTLGAGVETPISSGRALYWEGRALEALGEAEAARAAYARGAAHQTSFYGQLAAERAGRPMDPDLTGRRAYPDWREASFTKSSVFRAALILYEAGERALSQRFFAHLAEGLDEVGVGQLAEATLALGEPHFAVAVTKAAARGGVVSPAGYFPVVDLGVGDLPVPADLALAIARRESEFNPGVRSSAGAVGLMQVMPRTARSMAGLLKVAYSDDRLLSDPAYNARLGTTYLSEMIGIFGSNHLLVSAAYNAGPGRPIQWMERFGDPRDPDVDPVDWIEHIPFRETRNYVMRVMESLPVYRARLSGRTAPIRLSAELKAR